jgi:serine/threonine-protein kinase GIN4
VADAKPAAQKPKRLSDLIDSSIFIASPRARSAEILRTPDITITNDNSDDLMSSPFQTVEPYPSRPRDPSASPLPDTPSRLRTESVYDRFLMSTSGVKRVGSGYQSVAAAANHNGPVGHLQPEVKAQRRSSRMFATTSKRPMPPPVSSEDVRRAASVDELGTIGRAGLLSPNPLPADESSGTVWRALKAATTRRMSRVF